MQKENFVCIILQCAYQVLNQSLGLPKVIEFPKGLVTCTLLYKFLCFLKPQLSFSIVSCLVLINLWLFYQKVVVEVIYCI